ncbi:sigma-70 family RNA polymerase sigma factor [Micromonospora sp. NPDC093277]|uniref:sigma-70 family RNA polymerase sigma factor n=1 Tax=Micromonospora sp. NPDC093277 TaxID=3364291 RepID=UPI00382977E2
MAAIYEAHAPAVRAFLLRLTLGEAQLAEDLLQEAMLRAWRHLDRLSPDVDEVRPWLFIVARRIAIDATRARRIRPREVGAIDLTLIPDTDDAIERFVSVHAVRGALCQLSVDHRRVLEEVYVRQRSTREAAEILGIPEGTVKSRTHNALRYLRSALGLDDRAARRGGGAAVVTAVRPGRPSSVPGAGLPGRRGERDADRSAARSGRSGTAVC